MTAGLPLMKNILTPLAKRFMLPLILLAGMSAADAETQNNIYGSGTTTLIISNKEVADIMKGLKLLKESKQLIEAINETVKNKAKNKKKNLFHCYQEHQLLVCQDVN